MPAPLPDLDKDALPVGRTPADQERNARLLAGYDYAKYPESLTGYTGQDLQRIALVSYREAVRTRVGDRGNYKAGLAITTDGDLVLATCRNIDGIFHLLIYRSGDLGLTWKRVEHRPMYGKEPALAALADGTLLLAAQGGVGPGTTPIQVPLYRSTDGGATWTLTPLDGQDYPRNFIEMPGAVAFVRAQCSSWALRLYEKERRKAEPSPHLQICSSRDGGRNWTFSEGTVDWDCTAFGEVAAVRLDSGKMLAALRRQLPGTTGEGFEDTVLTESTDGGRSWSSPWRLLNTAEVHAYLTELSDGRLLATYSTYHVPWGVFAVASRDEGRTWDLDHPVQLSLSNGFYVGWPVTLQAPDGSLVTTYAATTYAEQPPDRVTCECVRWRLP